MIAWGPQEVLDQVLRPGALVAGVLPATLLAHLQLGFGTCGQESRFQNIKQWGGPALGYFQMEPRTHQDLWTSYVDYRGDLKTRLEALLGAPGCPPAQTLLDNPVYAAAMMFVKYLDSPGAIPVDLAGQAAYYKRYYNSPKGAATVGEYLACWARYSPGIKWEEEHATGAGV